MGDLSEHFSSSEFRCRDDCGYGQPHPRLIARLERLREVLGDKPVVIVSGLRCPPHNRAVGGASRSRHQSGEGCDIRSGIVKRAQAERAGFTGIGLKDGWVVHVDVRQTKRPVVWTY